MTIQEVYERYQHLDGMLNRELGPDDRFESVILRDCWESIRVQVEVEQRKETTIP